jgi:hypothetical protein
MRVLRDSFSGVVAVSALAFLTLAPGAEAQTQQDELRFSVTPYIWLPTVDGELGFNIPPGAGGSPDIEVGPVDYLENLQGVFMIAGEVRYRRFGAFSDFIYIDFSNEDGSVTRVNGPGPLEIPFDIGTQVDFNATLWSLAAGYDVVDNEQLRVQLFGGMRNLNAEASVQWSLAGPLALFPQSGEASREEDVWDALIGVRGAANTENWTFPYYLDVGTGSSDLTWQASVGVGYRFNWGEISAYYRGLHYEQDASSLVQNLDLSGPAFGATFRF